MFIRLALESDTELIEAHIAAATLESSAYRGKLRSQTEFDEAITLVAGYGSSVMGSARATFTGTAGFIEHIFVTPETREVGLGDALLLSMLDEFRQRGVREVSAQALPGDRAMKNLFERHGLIAQTIVVGKSL